LRYAGAAVEETAMAAAADWQTREAAATPDAIAPDGSEVRLLSTTTGGSMALFTLPPGAVAHAVTHRTVEELWYVTAGSGRIWRRGAEREETVALRPGVSVSLPVGTTFQFRSDGTTPLVIVGVTLPSWPGADEAVPTAGAWTPTVS
jgi:mannose-6-phosphate isomerase-like protein (cupin superfamily)